MQSDGDFQIRSLNSDYLRMIHCALFGAPTLLSRLFARFDLFNTVALRPECDVEEA